MSVAVEFTTFLCVCVYFDLSTACATFLFFKRMPGFLSTVICFSKKVLVPPKKKIGIRLMTISHKPVVQAVTSKDLLAQGLMPCDVIVTVDGKAVGDASAVRNMFLPG